MITRSWDSANGLTIRRLRGKPLNVHAEHWWHRSTRCAGGDCILVARDAETVLVQDSKCPASTGGHLQEWSVDEWHELLRAIRLAGRESQPSHVALDFPEFAGEHLVFGLPRHDKLFFDIDEWRAFRDGVIAGEFQPEKLSSPAEVCRGGGPVAGREVEPAEGHGFDREAATGAVSGCVARGVAAPVAADLAPTGSDDRYWFGTITVPPAGRVLSISEVDAIVTTGQPGPETGPPPVKPPFYGISAARRDHDPASLLTASRVLPEAAHTDSSAPAAEDRPVTGDRSEAGTGEFPPAPVPAARSFMGWVEREYRQCIVAARVTHDGYHYERANGRAEAYRQAAQHLGELTGAPCPDWDQIRRDVPPDGIYRRSDDDSKARAKAIAPLVSIGSVHTPGTPDGES